MDIHVHHYQHDADDHVTTRLERIEQLLLIVTHNERTLMAQFKNMDELVKAIDQETNRIATEVADLTAQQQRTDLTAAEEDALQARLSAVKDRLSAIGKNPAQPIPPVPTA